MPIGPLRAQGSDRGSHPDITPEGNLRPEVYTWADPEERDTNRKFAEDQVWAGRVMDRVSEQQSQLPEWIQSEVAGQTFGAGRGFAAGFVEYQQRLAELKREEDRYAYGHDVAVIRDDQVADMSLQEYDTYFDDNGKPRPGVVLKKTRGVSLDDGIDPASQSELRNR